MSNYQINQDVVNGLSNNFNTVNDKINSNRIISIPQDIHLELNNGKLTLKAGSKVYIPNGFESDGTTRKFTTVVVGNDLLKEFKYDSNYVVFYTGTSIIPEIREPTNVYSGENAPTGNTYMIWFKPSDNLIYWTNDGGKNWLINNVSLPLGIVTCTNGSGFTKINNIFDGYGFIGSTAFILPGIVANIPVGVNDDGTLINEIVTQQAIDFTTITKSWGTGSETFFFNGINTYIHRASKSCYYQSTQPKVSDTDNYWYNTLTGMLLETKDTGATWQQIKGVPAFTITFDASKITSLTSCGVHELANSNATNLSDYGRSIVAGLGKPSQQSIDLPIAASGTEFIAPTNGYVYCAVKSIQTPSYLSIDIPNNHFCGINGGNNVDLTTNQIALKQGDHFRVRYGNATVVALRFVYDAGCV